MRTLAASTLGMTIVSDPSLGVLAVSTVPNVVPPSVDSEIFTLFASRSVPLTSQVTGTDEPPATVEPAAACEVTRNGPAVLSTVRATSSHATPPPLGKRSRAVSRKLITASSASRLPR